MHFRKLSTAVQSCLLAKLAALRACLRPDTLSLPFIPKGASHQARAVTWCGATVKCWDGNAF